MTSILTNNAAIIALSTLRTISDSLDSTGTRVSTGKKISTAADGAAYWSIASTISSDNGALGAVKDAIALDKNTVDATSTGLNKILDDLDQIKTRLTAATSTSTARSQIQTEIKSYLDDIKSTSNNTVMNGVNWLSIDTSAPGYSATKNLVAAFARNGNSIAVSTTPLDISTFTVFDSSTAGVTSGAGFDALNAIIAAVGGSSASFAAVHGVMDTTYSGVTMVVNGTTQAVSDFTLSGIDIGSLADSNLDKATLKAYQDVVDRTLSALRSSAAKLGSTSTLLKSQSDFTQKLMDINTSSIGALVDANMEEESTKLKALQTQQQLAVQSLSIANSSGQNVLSLFK
ncbi:flagellin N-terminal helical domain-containing protein [Methylobacterium sp. JK268]